jgi:hypothetical protein
MAPDGESMQERRTDGVLNGMAFGLLKSVFNAASSLALGVAVINAAASAQSIKMNVDSSLADYLLETVCSNMDVDEDRLRSSPLVQAQIKHHTNLSQTRNFDALLAGLEAASRCEVPEKDVYRFGPIVENKEKFEATVAFLKGRASEIETFVVESLTPFVPEDLDYSGNIVLSIVGNPCGGFASEKYFFLALNCLTAGHEEEYSAIKVVSAHEVFHALQHEFFYPRSKDLEEIESRDDAIEYLFRWLMFEGTAEYAADSRQIEGSGTLTEFLTGFSENGYKQIALYIEFLSYTAEILTAGSDAEDHKERLRNIYNLGFSGSGRQVFYYTGAAMAGHMDKTYGRDALICIFRLPTEQFVRAYHAAALKSPSGEMVPLGETIVKAADRISRKRGKDLRFERCVDSHELPLIID